MIQNEVTEIKKIMTKNDCCIHGLAGCYVDANKEMHILEQGKFLVLQEEEQHKYFDLIKKGLSGRIGKNLLNLVFRTENGVAVPNRDTLMQVLNSELKDPQVLQAYFVPLTTERVFSTNKRSSSICFGTRQGSNNSYFSAGTMATPMFCVAQTMVESLVVLMLNTCGKRRESLQVFKNSVLHPRDRHNGTSSKSSSRICGLLPLR